jgi:hypothetical protein
MTGSELDVPEGHPGVEGGHDEGRAEHVRARPTAVNTETCVAATTTDYYQ